MQLTLNWANTQHSTYVAKKKKIQWPVFFNKENIGIPCSFAFLTFSEQNQVQNKEQYKILWSKINAMQCRITVNFNLL